MFWQRQTLPLTDGAQMQFARVPATHDTNQTVLLLAGRGQSIETQTDIAQEWLARGKNVVMSEWPGQGLSSRDRGQDVQQLGMHLEELVKRCTADGDRLTIMATSMGAEVATNWLLKGGALQNNIERLIVTSPMYGIKFPLNLPASFMHKVTKAAIWAGYGNKSVQQSDRTQIPFEGNEFTADRAHYAAQQDLLQKNPDLKPDGATFNWLNSAMNAIDELNQRLPREGDPKPSIPILIMAGTRDGVIDLSKTVEVAERLGAAFTLIPGDARHEIFAGPKEIQSLAWREIDAFCAQNRPVSRRPAALSSSVPASSYGALKPSPCLPR